MTSKVAYRVGFLRAVEAADELCSSCISPSMAERREWAHAWREFMRGWRAGLQHARHDDHSALAHLIEADPSSDAQMAAAGFRLVRTEWDPVTYQAARRFWVRVDEDEGS